MDQFEFVFENDNLIRNEISKTESPNVFQVKKVPVINREVFLMCLKQWTNLMEDEDA